MNYSDYIIYADESGGPNLTPVDPNYPVFVLNFCVFRKDRYADSVQPAVSAFKFKHFGHDTVVLHEQDIHRGKAPFDFGGNSQEQTSFRQGLNAMVAGLDYGVIATVIDKLLLAQTTISDAYGLALQRCIEQVSGFLETRGQHQSITHIVIESRGRKEDSDLAQVFQRIGVDDNALAKATPGFDMVFATKNSNSIGLQIADLTAYPIGRKFVAPDKPNRVWETLVNPKLLGEVEVLPQSHEKTSE